MNAFQVFLETRFPGARIEPISDSNNLVYRVDAPGGAAVAKHVTDTDIPLRYLADANAVLAAQLPVQRILEVYETERGDPFDAVLAEYVEGEDLVAALRAGRAELTTSRLVDTLYRFVAACQDLPRMHEGFTLYKRAATPMASLPEFVVHHARRYWDRVRPFYAGSRVAEAVDDWLDGGFAAAAGRNEAPDTVVPVDANLRNFLLTPDGRIVVLNVPIAALSTPAHGVGAISSHLRHSSAYRPFIDAFRDTLGAADIAMVPHFEVWTLLGILSFYAVRQPDRPRQWRNWGSPVPLYDDFADAVESAQTGSARR